MNIVVSILWRTAALFACVHAGAVQAVCHVKADAGGANNGTTWTDAFTDLQTALHEPTCNEIWVARGVYKPTPSTTDRAATFSIPPGFRVLGGFVGTEVAADQADPGVHRTVLSGDIDNDDTVDSDGVTVTYSDQRGSNSYTIVRMDGSGAAGPIGNDTVLDGFAITAGTGTPGLLAQPNWTFAGGLYCSGIGSGHACSPLLTRLWFVGHNAFGGAGAFFRGEGGGTSAPIVRSTTFSGNFAEFMGSAIFNDAWEGTVSPTLGNVTFADNASVRRNGSDTRGTIFNQAYGAAAAVTQTLRSVTFKANIGPAMFDQMYVGAAVTADLENTIVWDATGDQAFVSFVGSSTVTVRDSVVRSGCAGVTTCTAVSNANPLLGSLQDNGGTAPTTLPGVGGSALDAGNPDTCGTPPHDIDQRGYARPQGAACDVGAAELRQVQLAVGVSGPGSITAAASGSTATSGGIAACDEEGVGCIAGYAIEPATATVVLDLAPAAQAQIASISDICGPGGTAIGTLVGSTYTITPLTSDCMVMAQFGTQTYSVSGEVSGLAGSGLALSLNDAESLPIVADGAFTFATPLASGSAYAVTVVTSPSQPAQTCVVGNGSGTIGGADVSDVTVTCTTDAYSVGGAVTGLLGSGMVLQLDSQTLPIAADGAFTFPTPLASGSAYAVTVATSPSQPAQTCTVGNGSGTIGAADIDNVAVICEAPTPHLILSIDNSHPYLRYGRVVDYLVTLRNTGEGAATAVAIAGTLSDAFDGAFLQWRCLGAGAGATCAESGNGEFADTADLPSQRSLSWLISVPIRADATDAAATFAVAVAGATPATVADTSLLVLLRGGFDVAYGDGVQTNAVIDGAAADAVLAGNASHTMVLPATADRLIDDVLFLRGNGGELRLQRLSPGRATSVRLLWSDANGRERATRWVGVDAPARLTIGSVAAPGARRVLLEGAQAPLELAMDTH